MTESVESVRCDDAGLVLLNQYFPMLFKHMDLLDGHHFAGPDAPARAIAALHYLAAGQDQGDADHLPLCKLLAGLPLDSRPPAAGLTEKERALCDSLLRTVIDQWPAIGQQSLAGFRGNFLRRPGVLVRGDERWTLTVEKRAYDVLIARSPFQFAAVRHGWMPQPIDVRWPA